jgi:hypothetical protein
MELDGMAYILHGLARENTAHLALDPLLIGLGRSRMPPVQTIKLQQQGLSQMKPELIIAVLSSTLQTLPRPRSKSL